MKSIRHISDAIKRRLSGLSFRTGVYVLILSLVFYVLSFVCLALPMPYYLKGLSWALFFGLAKTAQYSGLLIIGKVGVQKIKGYFKRTHT